MSPGPVRIIALEGPSDSGKSTLAAGLGNRFGSSAVVLPCYVDLPLPGQSIPPARAADRRGQWETLERFIALDLERSRQWRHELQRAQLVIADRCWLSLAAHTFAVEQTRGPAIFDAARERLLGEPGLLRPDLVLYLDAGPHTRRERMNLGDKGRWFTEPAFNDHLDRFYRAQAPELVARLERLDARLATADLLTAAAGIVADGGRADG